MYLSITTSLCVGAKAHKQLVVAVAAAEHAHLLKMSSWCIFARYSENLQVIHVHTRVLHVERYMLIDMIMNSRVLHTRT
jgi:hypothetical protein